MVLLAMTLSPKLMTMPNRSPFLYCKEAQPGPFTFTTGTLKSPQHLQSLVVQLQNLFGKFVDCLAWYLFLPCLCATRVCFDSKKVNYIIRIHHLFTILPIVLAGTSGAIEHTIRTGRKTYKFILKTCKYIYLL